MFCQIKNLEMNIDFFSKQTVLFPQVHKNIVNTSNLYTLLVNSHHCSLIHEAAHPFQLLVLTTGHRSGVEVGTWKRTLWLSDKFYCFPFQPMCITPNRELNFKVQPLNVEQLDFFFSFRHDQEPKQKGDWIRLQLRIQPSCLKMR